MNWPDCLAILTHWREWPPPYITNRLIAQALGGWNPKQTRRRRSKKPASKAATQAFAAAIGVNQTISLVRPGEKLTKEEILKRAYQIGL